MLLTFPSFPLCFFQQSLYFLCLVMFPAVLSSHFLHIEGYLILCYMMVKFMQPHSRPIISDLEPLYETPHPMVYLSEPGREQYLLPRWLDRSQTGIIYICSSHRVWISIAVVWYYLHLGNGRRTLPMLLCFGPCQPSFLYVTHFKCS